MGEHGSQLTRKGWSLLGAAVGLFIGSRILGVVEIGMLALVIAALIGFSAIWAARTRVRLRATRLVRPQRTMVGEEVRVDLTVTNDASTRSPLSSVSDLFGDGTRAARFGLPSLPSGERASAAYRVPTERRGRFSVGPLVGVVTDPFGLVRRRTFLVGADELVVRPRVQRLTVPPLAGGTASDHLRDARALIGEGEEFRALREYTRGDDLRHVHWRSTARRDQLMIRQHEHHRRAAVTVYLDVRPDPYSRDSQSSLDHTSFERAVEAAASVAFSFAGTRRNLRLVLSTGEALHGSLDAVLDQLAVIEPGGPDRSVEALALRRERALLVLVVATVDPALASYLVQLRRDGPVVIVTTATAGVPVDVPVVDATTHVPLADAWNVAVSGNLAHRTQHPWNVAPSPGSPAQR